MKPLMTRLFLGVVYFACALLQTAAGAEKPAPYTLALIPQRPPVDMYRDWTPFLELLSQKSGLKLELKVFAGMEEFEEQLESGLPDFIFTNSTQAVQAWRSQRYLPLVRSSAMLKGVLFVKKDSPVTEVNDLLDKKIAFVGAKNLCSVFVRDGLHHDLLAYSFIRLYEGSTQNVFKTVLLGKADAGVTLDVNLDTASNEIREGMRIIYQTAPLAPHPLSAHPRLPQDVRERILAAILALGANPKHESLLKSIGLAHPIPADYQRDYRSLEEIDLKALTAEPCASEP